RLRRLGLALVRRTPADRPIGPRNRTVYLYRLRFSTYVESASWERADPPARSGPGSASGASRGGGGTMSGLRGAARAARRCAMWLVPAGRRAGAKARWTQAARAPPGRARLA